MLPLFIPSSYLAKVLDISQRRVQQLVNEGVLIKNEDNKFDITRNVEMYYRWKLRTSDTPQLQK